MSEPSTPDNGTVTGLPVPEPERYVTRAQLAEIMGVSVPTIDRMVAEGMPSETWGMRARRFRPSIALAWARTRERRGAESRSHARGDDIASVRDPDPSDSEERC